MWTAILYMSPRPRPLPDFTSQWFISTAVRENWEWPGNKANLMHKMQLGGWSYPHNNIKWKSVTIAMTD